MAWNHGTLFPTGNWQRLRHQSQKVRTKKYPEERFLRYTVLRYCILFLLFYIYFLMSYSTFQHYFYTLKSHEGYNFGYNISLCKIYVILSVNVENIELERLVFEFHPSFRWTYQIILIPKQTRTYLNTRVAICPDFDVAFFEILKLCSGRTKRFITLIPATKRVKLIQYPWLKAIFCP